MGASATPRRAVVSPGLERLRAGTREAHAAIEQALDWQRRTATIAGYRDLLCRFYGVHAAWEPAVAAALGDPALFEPRRRTPRLEADLAVLGVSAAERRDMPRCTKMPLAGAAEALGVMYVLEGATLGGQVITRHVARTLGLTAGHGCSYFAGHGAASGAMWRAFCARLADDLPNSAEIERASVAAEHSFATLRAWLVAPEPIAG